MKDNNNSKDGDSMRSTFRTGRKKENPYDYESLRAVEGTEQYAVAGQDKREKYVGHISYSPSHNTLVYQSIRHRDNTLKSVNGIAISEHILDEIRDTVDYAFIGFQEKRDILIIPIDEFDEEWSSEEYDTQYYANKETDVEETIENGLKFILSDRPSIADNVITRMEYIKNEY